MKLSDARTYYEDASDSASKLIEKLSFAGIAAVLILVGGLKPGPIVVSPQLKAALILFVLALGLALLQSLWKTFCWICIFRWQERKMQTAAQTAGDPKKDAIDNPRLQREIGEVGGWVNWISWTAFWAKAGACIAGWIVVLSVVGAQLQ